MVEVVLREEGLVELLASALAGVAVKLLRVREQLTERRQSLPRGFETRRLVLVELAGEPASLVADVAEAGGDLVLRPVGVSDQVEEAIFFRVEFTEPACDARADLGLSGAVSG
ncbi:hypothetical protein [Actinoplanes sp. NPDC051411]|uniref:hypothetical protein n=1 Tax=Actinoplanes sp. NPDC051411 TaxID=3155522 RepID=UPI0034265979